MPITFDCPCGKTLRVADEFAGRRVKCPACSALGTVPQPDAQFEIVEDDEGAPRPKARPVAKATSRHDDDDEDGGNYAVAKSKRDDYDDEDEQEDRRPKKPKKVKTKPADSGRSFEGRVLNGGVAGGVLAMIGAVVWCAVGLIALDRFFIYTPVLFIIGFIAFIKGLVSGE